MRFYNFFFCFLVSFFGLAQENNVMEFSGVLTTTENQVVSFKLLIEELEGDNFSGFSTTDFEGEDYTQSHVEGIFDVDKGVLSFNELSNTETKSTADASTFCYISVKNLSVSSVKSGSVTNGKFIGTFPTGETCAEGVLMLSSETNLEEVKTKLSDQILSADENNRPSADTTDLVMTANERVLVDKWEKEVKLEVWDGDKQDSDVIDVYLNGELFQERVLLRNKKKVFVLPGDLEEFELKIMAHSEGYLGLNTVNFHLINASDDNNYVSELNKWESFEITFRR